ncbi:glycoside hydrolase family 97 catalytic domain-containing protein [Jiangella mangrovi]|uniref:Alpha-glucosidase n=1 Tax=Jiangella mangrovi TaxID=1524084 RepID=A0A7W9LPI6_9ACTN|nr:alpha-glucosidase [Jiangella mangrovi]
MIPGSRRRRRPAALAAAAVVVTTSVVASLMTTDIGVVPAQALTTHTVTSPDGEITFAVHEQASGALTYEVTAGTTTIFEESPLGIATSGVDFSTGLAYASQSRTTIDDTYTLPAGTKPSYRDHANELVLSYTKGGQTMRLVVRAYDDGVAYRYELPGGSGAVSITDETSGFRLPAPTGGWAAVWNGNYEQDYVYRSAAGLNDGTELTMPLLASIDDNAYFTVISEANVYNADASYAPSLLKGSQANDGLLNVERTPDQAFPISSTYPFQTPWRAAVIAADLDTLVNSDLVQHLNPPATADADWVKPGRAAWSWFSDGDSAADLDKQKQMVDFAASMGFEYVTVDCCYDPDVDLPAISQYAAQRNVDIFAWVTAEPFATPAQADALVSEHKAYGVVGLKVDFFLNDSQEVMGWYQSIGDAAGEHELMLNFHGSTKPGGENRTWPWVVTSEAVAGTEHYLYPPPTTARLDATFPFVRNPIGGMDYTPTMISLNGSILTQAHTLAQAVVFTSGMVNYSDSAAAYEQWPGRHLMRAVPTVWDETRVVEGFPGDHVTMARRSGDDWFIGAMTDPARTASVPLSFLGSGTYTATIFGDDANGRVSSVTTQQVTSASTLSLPMIATGGAAVHISKTPLAQIGSGDVRYEAEAPGNTLSGGAVTDNCKGCSGGAKVGFLGNGGAVQFNNVMAGVAGTHELTFTYTSGDPRSIQIEVNGSVVGTEALKDSGGWEFVNKWTIDVPLNAGANTIRFSNPAAFGPDIDALIVSRHTEAEAAGNTLASGATVSACGPCSGGSKVTGLGGGGSVRFNGLTATAAGNHTVRVDYAATVDSTAQVSVGGAAPVTVEFPSTGGATATATVTLGLGLNAGAGNTVTVTGGSGAAPDIDRITVTN